MMKVTQLNKTIMKKEKIKFMLIDLFISIGIDIPSNFEIILQYCYDDVCETADPDKWHDGDVAIAFRRWIESHSK